MYNNNNSEVQAPTNATNNNNTEEEDLNKVNSRTLQPRVSEGSSATVTTAQEILPHTHAHQPPVQMSSSSNHQERRLSTTPTTAKKPRFCSRPKKRSRAASTTPLPIAQMQGDLPAEAQHPVQASSCSESKSSREKVLDKNGSFIYNKKIKNICPLPERRQLS